MKSSKTASSLVQAASSRADITIQVISGRNLTTVRAGIRIHGPVLWTGVFVAVLSQNCKELLS